MSLLLINRFCPGNRIHLVKILQQIYIVK